jgi:hypothetical protein
LGNAPFQRAIKGQPHMLEFEHGIDRFIAHKFDRVLVTQVIRAFDRIVGVPLGVILFQAAEAAPMPPCAAPVCDRVGYSLLITAVLAPREAYSPAISPAPPAPTTTTSN